MEENSRNGSVKLWEGSCQGWTAAASFSPRPKHPIQVMSLDGKYLIPFYPDDLKALETLLWANSLIQDHTVMQGMRCQSRNPSFNQSNGHVEDLTCEGVDPSAFHTSVLEIVGARKSTFIINRKNNQQVWNQPIAGYELHYFNPISGDQSELNDAIVPRSSYSDPFSQYRNANAKSIVGVEMKLKYISETRPDHRSHDDESKDNIKSLNLRYDLELDENQKIVGGEWRNAEDPDVPSSDNSDDSSSDSENTASSDEQNADIPTYPGFIWKFESDTPYAFSIADGDIVETNANQANIESVIAASKKAAQFHYNHYQYDSSGNSTVSFQELKPQPLEKVLRTLIDQSRAE